MAQFLPIILTGQTLGQRQRYLNLRVHQAVKDLDNFQDIENLPERSPVDRLFKIDVANNLKNIDYILKTLKDDDMLYVSRALKCKWLVEQRDIINPKYLEDVLFPEMVMPAISKLKHWLYINLRNSLMCQEFYMYYKDTKFDYALKFLIHCEKEFIFSEFAKILTKLTPHYLKVFAEKYPILVKVYFDALPTNEELTKRYCDDEVNFYKNIICVLKSEPDVFLDIVERYHNMNLSKRLSPSATEFIVRFHKSRLIAKPELYVIYLLHIPTVAKCLLSEECQEVVLKLARASFLGWDFYYKRIEPLIKRISRDKRAAFKKLVFVEKKIGDLVESWPYKQPQPPMAEDIEDIFLDTEYEPIHMLPLRNDSDFYEECNYRDVFCKVLDDYCPVKSELQKLFDEFRFVGFEGTLDELRARIRTAQSADRRRDMLLVLVSKTGGRADAVRAMLQLALRLRNEPVHERASIVRSLVNRASAWRLPQDVWDTMLEYGRGLGLDGSKPEAECREGLHAVVLRQLIATGDCNPTLRTAFLEDFTTLAEYRLVASERLAVAAGLQRILATAATEVEPEVAADYLRHIFDVLTHYHIPYKSSQAVASVVALADRNFEAARPLLVRLYEARVNRRELLRQYLKFRHDDAALLNALRHDPDAIAPEWVVNLLVEGETRANMYLSKVALYFNEANETTEKIRQYLEKQIVKKPDVKLARPLATLAGSDISSLWREQDAAGDKHRKLAAELRANMHRARPAPDALAIGWRKAGMKAVACRAMRCRPAQVKDLAQSLLEKREKRTMRLALILAQRTDCALESFSSVVTLRPQTVLRVALQYFKSLGDAADLRIWYIIKPLLSTVDLFRSIGLVHVIKDVDWVPKAIKPDYCAMSYLALDNTADFNVNHVLKKLMKLLPQVSDDLFENMVLRTLEDMDRSDAKSFPALVIRYLMLSKSNDDLKVRLEKIGEPFLAKVFTFRDENDHRRRNFFTDNFEQLLSSLQYNTAFFDARYQHCLPVIERFKTWMEDFLPKEMYFKYYVKIHATMLYYKTVRQSMKQKPEVFDDPAKKMSEGVDIVGYTLGRYVAKELAELKKQYFDSIIEMYRKGFLKYLKDYIRDREYFGAAVIKGILSESEGNEARLAVYILEKQYSMKDAVRQEVRELMFKRADKETVFFAYAC